MVTVRTLLLPLVCLLLALSLAPFTPHRAAAEPEPERAAPFDIQDPAAPATPLRDWLVVPSVFGGRQPLPLDPIFERYLARPGVPLPQPGEAAYAVNGRAVQWMRINGNEEGMVQHQALGHGWAVTAFQSSGPGTAMLEVRGPLSVHVNGVAHFGDVYHKGRTFVPVPIVAGENRVWAHAVRGRMKIVLHKPPVPHAFSDDRDLTIPDVRAGELLDTDGALLVVNPTNETLRDARLVVGDGTTFHVTETVVPSLAPYQVYKAPFRIRQRTALHPVEGGTNEENRVALPVRLRAGDHAHQLDVNLRIRSLDQPYRVTFRSRIDDSVQYYAIRPPRAETLAANGPHHRYGLFLSLHGASVEGMGQARSYAPKEWGFVVSPTNRRPFGFDWEDWGRMDAMEVLEHALHALPIDRSRVYVTGHSMGGHGTWHLAATYPDRFAAAGPSAGWSSLFSYGGMNRGDNATPPQEYFVRALLPSDTIEIARNLAPLGIYILHGDKDDNVPMAEAQKMIDALKPFHTDLRWHFQPGAGHWWGPRANCVDWAPMFEMFQRRVIPHAPRRLDFRTSNLGVSARHFWLTVAGQPTPFALSHVNAELDDRPEVAELKLTTENIDRLVIDLSRFGRTAGDEVALTDGNAAEGTEPTTVTLREGGVVRLERVADRWRACEAWPAHERNPQRYGLFKGAFDQRFLLVYGTTGSAEETAANLAKARFDASTWLYQGNGAARVIADTDLSEWMAGGRNVILYGNANTNSGFARLLGGDQAMQLTNGSLKIGGADVPGGSLAVLAIRPRPDDPTLSVGIVGATDLAAMRRILEFRWFGSGRAHPDISVFGPEMLARQYGGVMAAGYFGRDWSANPDAGADIFIRGGVAPGPGTPDNPDNQNGEDF